MSEVLDTIHTRGHRVLLTEGGPHLVGQLLAAGLLDELFPTIAPVPAGRADTTRPGLVAGQEFLPAHRHPAHLVSARRHTSYLFLRYQFHHPVTNKESDTHPHPCPAGRPDPGAGAALHLRAPQSEGR